MCLHILIGVITRCEVHADPGHDNNANWRWETYKKAFRWAALIIAVLLAFAMIFEYMRSRGYFGPSITQQETGIALVVACVVALFVVFELLCLYPDIRRLLRGVKPVPSGDSDSVAEEGLSEDPEQPPDTYSITAPSSSLDDDSGNSVELREDSSPTLEVDAIPASDNIVEVPIPPLGALSPHIKSPALPPVVVPAAALRPPTPTARPTRGATKMD